MSADLQARLQMITTMVLERLSSVLCASELEAAARSLSGAIALALEREEEREARDAVVAACAHLGELGFFTGTSGNVSVRCGRDRILITPSGIYKGALSCDDLVMVDLEGTLLEGWRKPTSEVKMHLAIYRHRGDVSSIVHGHPPYATGFAAARVSLDREVLPEAILILGKIPLVEYSTPSTREVPDNLVPHLPGCNAFLLANHGALTLGASLAEASHRMETLELYAKVLLIARLLGGERLLTDDELKRLAAANP